MKLYIVRHGQPEWNALHKVCGATDAPLTEKGRAQAAETAALVAELTKDAPLDLIIASPYPVGWKPDGLSRRPVGMYRSTKNL